MKTAYLTFGDTYSGVYKSQVIDVVSFLKENCDETIRLIAFVSIRDFSKNKKQIKESLPDAVVLPMFPKLKNWRSNALLLKIICRWFKLSKIIARNPIATKLALLCKEKNILQTVVYDGRGAVTAEWNEYNVVDDEGLKKEIREIEKSAILNTDYRVAVSRKLVDYWKQEFGYSDSNHVVIPCTIDDSSSDFEMSEEIVSAAKNKMGFHSDNTVFAYAGSTAGWQSMQLLDSYLRDLLLVNNDFAITILGSKTDSVKKLQEDFGPRVFNMRVPPNEVTNYLVGCDYGLLIREQSITNQVASPVKFAEYLSCGLKVIISEGIGDYSAFVKENDCGFINNESLNSISKVSLTEKARSYHLAKTHFSKSAFISNYKKIIEYNS